MASMDAADCISLADLGQGCLWHPIQHQRAARFMAGEPSKMRGETARPRWAGCGYARTVSLMGFPKAGVVVSNPGLQIVKM